MQIITTYPIWLILLCTALSGLYVFILYSSSKQNKDLSKLYHWLLGGLRFVVVFLLSFFLLEPMIKKITDEKEQPIVIIAEDRSESITSGSDSSYTNTAVAINDFVKSIENDYDVRRYFFGEKISSLNRVYEDKSTNFSSLFQEIDNQFYNANLAATIVASDGLFNSGGHPLYYPFEEKYPIYTIGLGDTTIRKDFFFEDYEINEFAFLGNKFPIHVTVGANRLKGNKSKVELYFKGKLVGTKEIEVSKARESLEVKFLLEATEPGVQNYSVSNLGVG